MYYLDCIADSLPPTMPGTLRTPQSSTLGTPSTLLAAWVRLNQQYPRSCLWPAIQSLPPVSSALRPRPLPVSSWSSSPNPRIWLLFWQPVCTNLHPGSLPAPCQWKAEATGPQSWAFPPITWPPKKTNPPGQTLPAPLRVLTNPINTLHPLSFGLFKIIFYHLDW